MNEPVTHSHSESRFDPEFGPPVLRDRPMRPKPQWDPLFGPPVEADRSIPTTFRGLSVHKESLVQPSTQRLTPQNQEPYHQWRGYFFSSLPSRCTAPRKSKFMLSKKWRSGCHPIVFARYYFSRFCCFKNKQICVSHNDWFAASQRWFFVYSWHFFSSKWTNTRNKILLFSKMPATASLERFDPEFGPPVLRDRHIRPTVEWDPLFGPPVIADRSIPASFRGLHIKNTLPTTTTTQQSVQQQRLVVPRPLGDEQAPLVSREPFERSSNYPLVNLHALALKREAITEENPAGLLHVEGPLESSTSTCTASIGETKPLLDL